LKPERRPIRYLQIAAFDLKGNVIHELSSDVKGRFTVSSRLERKLSAVTNGVEWYAIMVEGTNLKPARWTANLDIQPRTPSGKPQGMPLSVDVEPKDRKE
jgi:hypothetical protein